MMVMMQTIEYKDAQNRRELEQLLAGVASGEQAALAELYHCTRGAVFGLALSILKHAQDAQDVTQDVFVRIWESAPTYRAQGTPMAWILTITRNLARMKLRQNGKRIELDDARWEAIPAGVPDIAPEDRRLLEAALAILSETERQAVLLHAVAGLKHREIAALLDIPLATALSKYHRALRKLKEYLKGDEDL